jgi:nucleotide-binding universal stress UspA family protein
MSNPVVVGIDASGSAADAVDWATAEAAARGCPLRIVHAFSPPPAADPHGSGPSVNLRAAGALLRDASARAHRIAPDLPVSTHLVPGSAVRVLVAQARDAGLLVLGGRDRRGLRALLGRSTSARVAARARCAVAVVRSRPTAQGAACSAPRVVAGVGDPATTAAVLDHGMRAAHQRGVPLVAVHAWTPDPPADVDGVRADPDQTEAAARRLLDQAVRTAASPDVVVVDELVCDRPDRALVARSRGAALLVVGAPERGRLRGLVSGSTARRVLRHSHCPTAVVPPSPHRDPAPDRRDAGRTTSGQ